MSKTEPRDYGTKELARQFTIVPRLSGPNNMTGKVVDETEIDRLLLCDAINANEHATLEGFMRRLHKTGFIGIRSPSYESPVQFDPSIVADKRAAALRGMVKLFKRLDEAIGSDKRRQLVDLVLMDRPWPGADLKSCIRALDDVIVGR